MTKAFIDDGSGNVKAVKIVSLKVARDDKGRPSLAEIEGSEQLIECDTVVLAMGFTGMHILNHKPYTCCAHSVFLDMEGVDARRVRMWGCGRAD